MTDISKLLKSVIGKSNGPRTMNYTWRDAALYALGVGAHKDDLKYLYENENMKTLPTFGLLPYLNALTMLPRRRVPQTPATLVDEVVIQELGGRIPKRLHMAMELFVHNPIEPLEGTFLCEDKVAEIYDRGEGKGIAVQAQMNVYDVAGQPLCTAVSTHAIFAFGGYGGKKMPSRTLQYPERKPDYVLEDHFLDIQAVLYRLSGDTYNVHIDPEAAKSYGFEEPYMQGLCSYGFACRMGIEAVCPEHPERLKYMYAQMRSVCFPDTSVQFAGWNMGNGKIYFRFLGKNSAAILDNGVMEFFDE